MALICVKKLSFICGLRYSKYMENIAILIGSQGGIGAALKQQLRDHQNVSKAICFSRSQGPDGHVINYEDEQSIANAARYLKDNKIEPTIIMVASGLLSDELNRPETQVSQITTAWAQKNFLINTIGPALVAKHFLPLMPRNRPIYLGFLSAKVGSISDNGLGGWHSYRASKAALNMIVKNLSIEWKRKNSESHIVALHPGTVNTPLSKPFQRNVQPEKLFSPERAAKQLLDVLLKCPPAHSGALLSWDGDVIAP